MIKTVIKVMANGMILLLMGLMFTHGVKQLINPTSVMNILNVNMSGLNLLLALFLLVYFLRGTMWLVAAMITTTVLMLLRTIDIIMVGMSREASIEIALYLIAVLTFYFIIKNNPTPNNYSHEIHRDFKKYRFTNYVIKGLLAKKLVNVVLRKVYKHIPLAKEIVTKQFLVEGYAKRQLNIDVYQLEDSPDNSPCIIAFHGGGFFMYSMPFYKQLYNQYILGTKAKLVYVDYTLSTHAPYPAAPEDCYHTALWVVQHADQLGIDKNRIALYGDSAGGALTAAVTQMLRDRDQFQPVFQMLIYPVTDNEMKSESAKKYTNVPIWNTRSSKDAFNLYMKGHVGAIPAYAYPLRATTFSKLPPAYVEIAEYDSLADDGRNYAQALKDAGNAVELIETKGTIHGFEINGKSELTKKSVCQRIDAFNKIFKDKS